MSDMLFSLSFPAMESHAIGIDKLKHTGQKAGSELSPQLLLAVLRYGILRANV